MADIKIVIIDDNQTRRETIKQLLPSYIDSVDSGYGEAALNLLRPDKDGIVPDMVIMNSDDSKGMGLYTFDWMKTKSGNAAVKNIPVLLLTDDEFSDKSMDFLEIEDAFFYEGEIEEDRLYSTVMEIINEREFAPEPVEPLFAESNVSGRISGLQIKPFGTEGQKTRSIVLNRDDQLESLEAALERGRQKADDIKRLLEAAVQYKSGNAEKAKRQNNKDSKTRHNFLDKVRVNHGKEPKGTDYYRSNIDETDDDIPDEFKLSSDDKQSYINSRQGAKRNYVADKQVSDLTRKVLENPLGAIGSHGTNLESMVRGSKNPQPTVMNNTVPRQESNKACPVVVVVDDNERDRQTCELFLKQKYNVVLLDSGMKAIDYFIKNRADLVLMDTVMPILGGQQTMASIRWQANGKYVPVIYLVGNDYNYSRESLAGEGVVGLLPKPVSAGSLAMAVDGFFRNKR